MQLPRRLLYNQKNKMIKNNYKLMAGEKDYNLVKIDCSKFLKKFRTRQFLINDF